ncbi:hypothetical protein N7454_006795 [Penicillium verhagenii]|nr:hypothetical protein N7454_006795 [Penicillium verhagenii]
MDDHPEHWRLTLMGWDFWKDATLYEEQRNSELNKVLDLNLHKRFPFNLGPEQGSHIKEDELIMQGRNRDESSLGESKASSTPDILKHRRKLSMSDTKAVSVSSLRRHKTVTAATSRLRELGRRVRSPSPSQSFPPWSPLGSRLSTLQSSPLKGKLPRPRQTTIEEIEVPASPPSCLSVPQSNISASLPTSQYPTSTPPTDLPSSDAAVSDYSTETATPKRPLFNFNGGSNWLIIPRSKKSLGLDMFCPYDDSDDDDDRSLHELKPLCEFRGLRSLKIVGMMQSYQYFIWQAAWLNLELDELELEMVLEPEIKNQIIQDRWKDIKTGWAIDGQIHHRPVYYGDRGDGELSHKIGYGEYLDKRCIEMAKVRALQMGQTSHRLSIRKLTLSGFIVDADPIIQWLDPEKLRSIHFKGKCIDAGLWLPLSMKKISIRFPHDIDLQAVPAGIVRVDLNKDLKALVGGKMKTEETVP